MLMCSKTTFISHHLNNKPKGYNMDNETLTLLLGALFAVSELLASVKRVRGNSIFQIVYGLLKKLAPRDDKNQLQ